MAFKKGKSGNPSGRPLGAKDKKSEKIRRWLIDIVENRKKEILDDLDAVDPVTRLQFIVKLLPYVVPRLSSVVTASGEDGHTVFILKEVDAEVDAEPLTIRKSKTGCTPASSEEEVMQREGLEGEVTGNSRDDVKRVTADIVAQDEEQRAHERLIHEQRMRMKRSGAIRQY